MPALTIATSPGTAPLTSLVAILTEATCGEACWHAREEICRCSCGGKNHGCLNTGGAAQPVRTCKIDGFRYELLAVGSPSQLGPDARRINEANGWASIDASIPDHRYHYTFRDTDSGAPARMKPASRDQILKWPELSAFSIRSVNRPYLLWKRVDAPRTYWCEDNCERCNLQREKYGV